MSSMIERAKLIAKMVHLDERRRNGEPYFNHCERVAYTVSINPEQEEFVICAAYLHDVFENAKNPNTIKRLVFDYFPREVYHLVEVLTHDKNIYYNRYIELVCYNPYAFEIKMADMLDNTDDINLPEKQKEKYKSACLLMISKRKIILQILKDRLNIRDD